MYYETVHTWRKPIFGHFLIIFVFLRKQRNPLGRLCSMWTVPYQSYFTHLRPEPICYFFSRNINIDLAIKKKWRYRLEIVGNVSCFVWSACCIDIVQWESERITRCNGSRLENGALRSNGLVDFFHLRIAAFCSREAFVHRQSLLRPAPEINK